MTTTAVPAGNTYSSAMDRAKKAIAPGADLEEWLRQSSKSAVANQSIHVHSSDRINDYTTGCSSYVTFDDAEGGGGEHVFRDNVDRIPGCSFDGDVHGDSLPHAPAVLTGLLEDWPAFANPGTTWSPQDLAARAATAATRVSLDGGPSFARMSIGRGRVTLDEYSQYCESGEAAHDIAPLYVFDPDILTSAFASDEWSTPECFSRDAMACIDGSDYRPLPPAWLLIGVKGSGTPIHDHPLTVAWNALLVGCKLWCCLPPDVDESALLLNLGDEDEDEEDECPFDLSALEWFQQCGKLPECAKIIVQRPGEVVYLPTGWFHVVLNVETSTAISVSLALRRDLPVVLPLLKESDEDFATFWMQRLREHEAKGESASESASTAADRAAAGEVHLLRDDGHCSSSVAVRPCVVTDLNGQAPFSTHAWVLWSHSHSKKSFQHLEAQSLFCAPFEQGEVVAVDQKSNTKHCQAEVVADPGGACPILTSGDSGISSLIFACDELGTDLLRRVKRRMDQGTSVCVRLASDGSIRWVQEQKLTRVLSPLKPRILVVPDTTSFRVLAKTQVGRSDAVLEVGSSLGEGTRVLVSHAGALIGVDVVKDLVEDCRARLPHCRFEWLDCFEEPQRLREYCDELRAAGTLKVFVDIGGDRTTCDVCRMLAAIDAAGPLPVLVVVKSKALAAAAAVACDNAGFIPDVAEAFWRRAAAPPAAAGSAAQQKKKLARARKARWEGVTEEEWAEFQAARAKWDDPGEQTRLACKAKERKGQHQGAWGDAWREVLLLGGGAGEALL